MVTGTALVIIYPTLVNDCSLEELVVVVEGYSPLKVEVVKDEINVPIALSAFRDTLKLKDAKEGASVFLLQFPLPNH